MNGAISQVAINGLWGRQTVRIPISDNKLILVGENGLGKSTIVNMLFYCLSRQWSRLAEFNFDSMELMIDNELVTVSHQGLKEFKSLEASIPTSQRERVANWLNFMAYSPDEVLSDLNKFMALDRTVPLRSSVIRHILEGFKGDLPGDMSTISNNLRRLFRHTLLFLPTYRRIEKELRVLFPEFEEKLREYTEYARRRGPSRGKQYVELVEFGMEDVDSLIARTMSRLKDDFRTALEKLTAEYLRDVLRREYAQLQYAPIDEHSEQELEEVLSRVGEDLLSGADRTMLKRVVHEMIEGNTVEDLVVAHFLRKLLALHRAQTAREQRIRTFGALCNKYLNGKHVEFNSVRFETTIQGDDSKTLEMRMLSSGEKQILSLFAHLYLSINEEFFVIIDEPELSLSVPWQTRFLEDVVNSKMCSGLIAVTHSPFIYDNSLRPFARPLGPFVEPSVQPTLL